MEKPLISFSKESDIEKRLGALEREVYLLKHRVKRLEEKVGAEEEGEPTEALLKDIPTSDPRAVEIVLDWVSFMLSRVGEENLDDLLRYYVSIGWISERVREILRRYALGLRAESVKGYMDPEDHVKSLEYINRLREAVG